MKDQITALMEPVRQAQAVLADYRDILDDKEVKAMRLLYPQEHLAPRPGATGH